MAAKSKQTYTREDAKELESLFRSKGLVLTVETDGNGPIFCDPDEATLQILQGMYRNVLLQGIRDGSIPKEYENESGLELLTDIDKDEMRMPRAEFKKKWRLKFQ